MKVLFCLLNCYHSVMTQLESGSSTKRSRYEQFLFSSE